MNLGCGRSARENTHRGHWRPTIRRSRADTGWEAGRWQECLPHNRHVGQAFWLGGPFAARLDVRHDFACCYLYRRAAGDS
jgi:hypothetical protein